MVDRLESAHFAMGYPSLLCSSIALTTTALLLEGVSIPATERYHLDGTPNIAAARPVQSLEPIFFA